MHYAQLGTESASNISNVSIRGQETIIRKEVESLGALQKFFSNQGKLHIVSSNTFYLRPLNRSLKPTSFSAEFSFFATIEPLMWHDILSVFRFRFNGSQERETGINLLYCLLSWWRRPSWIQKRTTSWVVTRMASWVLEPLPASALRAVASLRRSLVCNPPWRYWQDSLWYRFLGIMQWAEVFTPCSCWGPNEQLQPRLTLTTFSFCFSTSRRD